MAGCGATRHEQKTLAYERWQNTRAGILAAKGEQQFKSGDMDGAGSSAKEALSLSPGMSEARMLLARVFIEKGRNNQALVLLTEMAVDAPSDASIPYLQGVVHERRGRYEQALGSYEKARALDQDNPAYVMASVEVMVALGRADEALELLASKLVSMAESAGAYRMAGDLAMATGKPQAAIDFYRQARDIAPDRVETQEDLAKAYFFAGQYDRSATALEQLSKLDTYDRKAWVFLMLGDSALATDEPRKAKAAYTRLTDLQPKRASHWSKLATASLACGDLPRTVLSARRALRLDPRSADAGISLGYALLAKGEGAEALAVLVRAEKFHPDDVMLKCLLARCYSAGGQEEVAQKYYQAALKLDPANAVARQMIAQNDE